MPYTVEKPPMDGSLHLPVRVLLGEGNIESCQPLINLSAVQAVDQSERSPSELVPFDQGGSQNGADEFLGRFGVRPSHRYPADQYRRGRCGHRPPHTVTLAANIALNAGLSDMNLPSGSSLIIVGQDYSIGGGSDL